MQKNKGKLFTKSFVKVVFLSYIYLEKEKQSKALLQTVGCGSQICGNQDSILLEMRSCLNILEKVQFSVTLSNTLHKLLI